MEHLHEAWTVALGNALECSTAQTYSSGLMSYITFCDLHKFPLHPTPDTLSLFMVYMCHHIKPTSVSSYLSGICSELEAFWPEIHANQSFKLVLHTLAGCMKMIGTSATRKSPLLESDLRLILQSTPPVPNHNDLLFIAITFTGWHCLMWLGELIDPDNTSLRDYHKTIDHCSVKHHLLLQPHFSFTLPMHKPD